MFDNIGSKLKRLAMFLCVLGMVASVVSAIATWATGNKYVSTFWPGLLTLAVGCLSSWIGTWALYGIGEAADARQDMAALQSEIKELQHQLSGKNDQKPTSQSASNSGAGYSLTHMAAGIGNAINGWKCKHCGMLNSSTAQLCKDCGCSR